MPVVEPNNPFWASGAEPEKGRKSERRLEFPQWLLAWDSYALAAAALEQAWVFVRAPFSRHAGDCLSAACSYRLMWPCGTRKLLLRSPSTLE